jgi:hypothetical protein
MPRWEEGPYTRIQNRSGTLCLFTKFRRRMGRIPELLELCGNLDFYYENSVNPDCWFQNGTVSCELLVYRAELSAVTLAFSRSLRLTLWANKR